MFNKFNDLTKQLAEQASQAVKGAGIDINLENVGQQMAGGLDKLATSVLSLDEREESSAPQDVRSREYVMPSAEPGPSAASGWADSELSETRQTSHNSGKGSAVGHLEEENALLRQRLEGVEAAATEALGELEDIKDQLEAVTDAKLTAEHDLQKAKREVSRLKKQVTSKQRALDTKSTECDDFQQEIHKLTQEIFALKSAAAGAPQSSERTVHKRDEGVGGGVVVSVEFERQKEELKCMAKELEECEERNQALKMELNAMQDEVRHMRSVQELQLQQEKRHEVEFGIVSRKLKSTGALLDQKNEELTAAELVVQELEQQVLRIVAESERMGGGGWEGDSRFGLEVGSKKGAENNGVDALKQIAENVESIIQEKQYEKNTAEVFEELHRELQNVLEQVSFSDCSVYSPVYVKGGGSHKALSSDPHTSPLSSLTAFSRSTASPVSSRGTRMLSSVENPLFLGSSPHGRPTSDPDEYMVADSFVSVPFDAQSVKCLADLKPIVEATAHELACIKQRATLLEEHSKRMMGENPPHNEEEGKLAESLGQLLGSFQGNGEAAEKLVQVQLVIGDPGTPQADSEKSGVESELICRNEQLELEIRDLVNGNKQLKDDLESCQKELDTVLEATRKLEAMISTKDSELNALRHGAKAESNLAQTRWQQVTKELKEAKEEINVLENLVSELKAEKSESKRHARNVETKLDGMKEAAEKLQEELNTVRGVLADTKKEMVTQHEVLIKECNEKWSVEIEKQVGVVREEGRMRMSDMESGLRNELEVAQNAVQDLEDQLDQARKIADQCGVLEASNTKLQDTIDTLQSQITHLESTLSDSETKAENLLSQLQAQELAAEDRKRKFVLVQGSFKKKEEDFEARIFELESAIERSCEEAALAVERSHVNGGELEKLRKEGGDAKRRVEELEARCQCLTEELQSRREECLKLKIARDELVAQQEENQLNVNELEVSVRQLKGSLVEAESKYQEAKENLENAMSDVTEARQSFSSAQSRIKAAELKALDAEERANAAEQAKIELSLALAEMDDRKFGKGEQESNTVADTEIQPATSDAENTDPGPNSRHLKTKLIEAEDRIKQLQWQIKMMMDNAGKDGQPSTASWIFGCVSNRK